MSGRRIDAATRAAGEVLARQGLGRRPLSLLRDSEHVTLLAEPSIVARVSFGADAWSVASREIQVTRHLHDRGAPAVAPLAGGLAGPHASHGSIVTLWPYEEHTGPAEAHRAATALAACHGALASYAGPLPGVEEKVEAALRTLRDDRLMVCCPAERRTLLLDAAERLVPVLERSTGPRQAIHGDSHAGNTIAASRGALWIDWQDVCVGPIEWDAAHLPEDSASVLNCDLLLLSRMRLLVSWSVAVWCYAIYDRSPEKREAAEYHSGVLSAAFGT